MREDSSARLLLGGVLLLTCVYGVVEMIVRPIIWSDSAFGLLGWYGRDDLPFNFTAIFDAGDIAKDIAVFMSVWSPGQHLAPALLEAAGMSLGAAIVVVVTAFSLIGLIGWHTLYRAWGFSPQTSAIAVVVIALSRHFSAPFGIYVGGEVLLFGGAPWFLLMAWRLRNLPWFSPLPLVGGTLLMFLAKSNGIMLSAAAIAALPGIPRGPWISKSRIGKACLAGGTLAVIGVAFYWAWYSRGWTSVQSIRANDWSGLVGYVAFAVSATCSAAFSFMDLASYVLLRPHHPVFKNLVPIGYAFLPASVLTLILVCRHLRDRHVEYLRFWALTSTAYGFVMVWLWVHGSAIGIEERYLRIPSLMLLVAIVDTVRSLPRRIAVAAASVLAMSMLYGPASYLVHVKTNLGYPIGSRGFRHQIATRQVLDFVARIDGETADRNATLIYAAWPEIGLEVRRARVLAISADFSTRDGLKAQVFHGRVPRLYVLVEQALVDNGKGMLLLGSFVDYPADAWRKEVLDGAVGFYQ